MLSVNGGRCCLPDVKSICGDRKDVSRRECRRSSVVRDLVLIEGQHLEGGTVGRENLVDSRQPKPQ
jgi:hypothetical protein